MEKKTFDITLEVLKRFDKSGVLEYAVLIGSWCIYFYKYFFQSESYNTFIRTKDIDFVLPLPVKIKEKINLHEILEDLGFIETFFGTNGYIKLEHPDVAIEFLVNEKGMGSDKPYPLPQLGINAQPLRFLNMLSENVILIKAQGLKIKLPHPAAYALHKFIIFERRKNKDKGQRDIEGALRVFEELIREKKDSDIKRIFLGLHKNWQRKIIQNLKAIDELDTAGFLVSLGS